MCSSETELTELNRALVKLPKFRIQEPCFDLRQDLLDFPICQSRYTNNFALALTQKAARSPKDLHRISIYLNGFMIS
ncbi:MAG: hypothetical protein CMQ45_01550 [Gammaproteobacteria bacterium]|nr:hypothetical protein [Gammaproteobacteria bacterium]